MVNKSQLLIRMRVNSALGQVGLSQVGPVIYRPRDICLVLFDNFFIRDASMRCILYIKNVQQKFDGIMIGSIYIVGLSTLFHSTGPTVASPR